MYSFQPEKIECAYPIIKETVPKSSLGYASNNKYPEFPPLMSDGRSIIGSWQPESTENANLIESNGIKTNWEYRSYLTKNSKDILEYNFRESCNDAGYFKRPIDIPSIQSNVVSNIGTPFSFSSIIDDKRPVGYEQSDLKDLYLSREQLDARKIAPMITQDELLKKNDGKK
jgi:hypothetical protein